MQSQSTLLIDESNFKPTSLAPVLHHFMCSHCRNVVQDPKQCFSKNCQVLYCAGCVQTKLKNGAWMCPMCRERQAPVDIHRRLKEFLQLLKFNCPGCSESMMYEMMIKHIVNCEAALKVQQDGRKEVDG